MNNRLMSIGNLRAAQTLLLVLFLVQGCSRVETWSGTERLTAAVLEHADRWTAGSTGAARLLDEAGFTVRPLALDKPAAAQRVDLIVFGSFASESPDYRRYMQQHGESLAAFVEAGGVVVQFTQADQTEARVPFLPNGMLAKRCDEDMGEIHVRVDSHPLLDGWAPTQGSPSHVRLPLHLGRPPNWESFTEFKGLRILLSSDTDHRRPVLLEAAHGKGRFVVTSLFLDKVCDATGQIHAPQRVVEAARDFFTALHRYVGLVKGGRAPEVIPTPPYREPDPLPFVPGSFTLAVLPDTQVYSRAYPDHFYNQTRWIAENAGTYNIRYVLHLGDVTDHNTPPQWRVAKTALSRLDGRVPYAIAPGNHDYGTSGSADNRTTLLNEYFSVDECRKWPTFAGAMEAGKLDNTYHTFQANGEKFLILALEFGPRDAVVDWCNQIVAQHPDHHVVLITHAYLYYDDTIYDWAQYGTAQSWNPHNYPVDKLPGGTNDGRELWRKLVRKHSNFLMAISGHVLRDGLGYRASSGTHGNVVHQMLVNYQMKAEGGEGFLRLIEFLPDGETVQVKAYSPSLDKYKTDPQNQFVLSLDTQAAERR